MLVASSPRLICGIPCKYSQFTVVRATFNQIQVNHPLIVPGSFRKIPVLRRLHLAIKNRPGIILTVDIKSGTLAICCKFDWLLWSLGLREISKQFRTILQQKRCAHIGIFCLNVFFLSFPAIKTDVGPSDFPIIRMLSAVFSYQLIFEPFLIRIPDHLL